MTWIKYTLFFIAVFALFMLVAGFALLHPGQSAGFIGYWRDYDDASIGDFVVSKASASYWRQQKLYELKGHWSDQAFYSVTSPGSGTETIVARELPNEDLQVELKYFDPNDPRTITCVKIMRLPDEYHPYPVRVPGQQVNYPPPKGMIKEGMLQADLEALPWQPYTVEEPQYVIDEETASGSYHGSKLINAWPHVHIYKSDDPNLPELRVTTEEGRVTQVIGGAENSDGPSYFPPAPPSAANTPNSGEGRTWLQWLFDEAFKK